MRKLGVPCHSDLEISIEKEERTNLGRTNKRSNYVVSPSLTPRFLLKTSMVVDYSIPFYPKSIVQPVPLSRAAALKNGTSEGEQGLSKYKQ
jgi:hypothetical protein